MESFQAQPLYLEEFGCDVFLTKYEEWRDCDFVYGHLLQTTRWGGIFTTFADPRQQLLCADELGSCDPGTGSAATGRRGTLVGGTP